MAGQRPGHVSLARLATSSAAHARSAQQDSSDTEDELDRLWEPSQDEPLGQLPEADLRAQLQLLTYDQLQDARCAIT